MGQLLYSRQLSERRKVRHPLSQQPSGIHPSNLPTPAVNELFAGWVERVLVTERGTLHSDLVEDLEEWLSEVLASGRGIPTPRHPHGPVLSDNLEVRMPIPGLEATMPAHLGY